MRLKDYGRNRKERKEYIHQSGLLISGVNVSKAKYDACRVRPLKNGNFISSLRKAIISTKG